MKEQQYQQLNNGSQDTFLTNSFNRMEILIEGLGDKIQLVAEGVMMNSEKIERLRGDVEHLQEDMTEVKGRLTFVESDVADLKTNVADLRIDIVGFKKDFSETGTDVSDIKKSFATKTDLKNLESNIRKEIRQELKPIKQDILKLNRVVFA